MRVEWLLMLSMVAFYGSFALSLIFKQAWFVLVIGSLQLLVIGGLLAANYRNMVRDTPYGDIAKGMPVRLFGVLFASWGLGGLSIGLADSQIPVMVSIGNALFIPIVITFLVGLVGPSIAIQYDRRSSTRHKRE